MADDQKLYEKLCLEGFQAGLSWLTILRKRPGFRKAFSDFDFRKVAKFAANDVERLVTDAAIVRHRKKIEAAINNAQRAIELEEEFGSLGAFFWGFEPTAMNRPKRLTKNTLMNLSVSAESTALSKELKKRGWAFVGPTTVYAFMQAMGIVNDHLEGCEFRSEVEAERARFVRPC